MNYSSSGRRGDSRRSEKAPVAKGDTSEKVVFINRCAKVVKGGRRFSFSALIVAGDHDGRVGYGFGKANEVSEAIRKASEVARKSMGKVSLNENTIPHEVIGEFDGARVLLRPASPGTGIIAGGGVRAVAEAAGIRDVLAKSLGSSNHANVVKATIAALRSLRRKDEIFKVRGIASRDGKGELHAAAFIICGRGQAHAIASNASAAVKVPVTERPVGRGTKAKRRVPVGASDLDSKAGKCR